MSEQHKLTLGQAIDQLVTALSGLDPKSRQTAISAACEFLGVSAPLLPTQTGETKEIAPQKLPLAAANTSPAKIIDIRTLKEQKRPASAKQMAALVAYYLQELASDADRKAEIGTEDLEKYFKQAGFKLPEMMRQVLPDAKKSGYFESAGRGLYKLNAVGYNLVVHNLPTTTD